MSKTKPISVYLIDDEFPKTEKFVSDGVYNSAITADNLYHLAITEDWKSQHFLQQLIKDIISSKPNNEGMVKLLGFTIPTQALSFVDDGDNPDLIIYDWEYNVPKPGESQEWLLELFAKTQAVVFVYSQVRDTLPEFLNKNVFDAFANRFQLFLKGSSDNYIYSSEEFILQYILSKVSSNYLIKLQGIEVRFSENGYLEGPKDILFLERILGRNFILEQLKDLDFSITQENIEKLLEKSNGRVLFEENKKILVTEDSTLLIRKFNPQQELSYLEVLKRFGLFALKEVVESGYLKV